MRRLVASTILITTATACATISTQQEVQMGQEYSQQINAQLPILQDAEINRYINVLGDSIAKVNDPRNLQWHFYVVDTKEVNAFAVPGGYIYVNRGLIAQTDKMDQLAGVLGHEIGHVLNRHTVKLMEKENAANVGVQLGCILTNICNNAAAGAAINVAGSAVFAKFSRQDETEADESGVQNVTRAGIDPRGIPEMFQKLLDEQSSSPSTVAAWFATHPTEQSRIADTDAMIAKIDPVVLNSLTQDTPNFHAFKQRLQALPPSPPPKQAGN
jgi:predicted Zn-dependent protease